MRKKTGRKFVGVGKFTLNGTYDRHQIKEISDIIEMYQQITGKLPAKDTYPCPYFSLCGEPCMVSKSYNCDEYARREKLRKYGG